MCCLFIFIIFIFDTKVSRGGIRITADPPTSKCLGFGTASQPGAITYIVKLLDGVPGNPIPDGELLYIPVGDWFVVFSLDNSLCSQDGPCSEYWEYSADCQESKQSSPIQMYRDAFPRL